MRAATWVNGHFDRRTDYALITGASSGIGLEYLRAFASMGCPCIATSHDAQELGEACRSVRAAYDAEVVEAVADLADDEGVQQLLSAIAPYPIGVLVNNAGFGLKGAFISHDYERYARLVHLNALAPTLLSRAIIPDMLDRGRGLVVHVASVNACTPIAYNAVYTATKAFLLYYAYAVAYELRDTPLMFQIVLPGTTNTPFHARQGAVPSSLYMEPDVVVRRSLANVRSLLSISNRVDRLLFPLVSALPYWARVRIGTYLLKKRLKLEPACAPGRLHASH